MGDGRCRPLLLVRGMAAVVSMGRCGSSVIHLPYGLNTCVQLRACVKPLVNCVQACFVYKYLSLSVHANDHDVEYDKHRARQS